MKTRPPAEKVPRFMPCPASGVLHPPRALPLLPFKGGKTGCYTICGCLTRVFYNSPLWRGTTGYTAEECRKRGMEVFEPRV